MNNQYYYCKNKWERKNNRKSRPTNVKKTTSFVLTKNIMQMLDDIVSKEYILNRSLLIDSIIENYIRKFDAIIPDTFQCDTKVEKEIFCASIESTCLEKSKIYCNYMHVSRSELFRNAILSFILDYNKKGSELVHSILKPVDP